MMVSGHPPPFKDCPAPQNGSLGEVDVTIYKGLEIQAKAFSLPLIINP